MFKAFVRPHLDYGNIIYDEAYSETFHPNFGSFQYIACLALSGAIRVLSREKNYHELGLEPLQIDIGTGNFTYFIRRSKKMNIYLFNLVKIS